jgi:hypothetical protein
VPKEIHAILIQTLACFLPVRAKDLSAALYFRCFRGCHGRDTEGIYSKLFIVIIIIIIIIIIIYCDWVVTRWQCLFYMYRKCEIGYN